jgi:endonuclease/exonuclease/phosphatase (EEP) superfamily protein YafD
MPDDTSTERPFISTSVDWRGLIATGVMLGLSASWLGLLGRFHWALDLCSHFRWQYLVVCIVAVLWSLWQGRRVAVICSLLTLLLNAVLIGQLAWTADISAAPLAKDFHLQVVSFNVLTSNTQTDRVLAYLRAADADVIMLMEVDAAWERALEPLSQSHPHHLVESRQDNFGIALFSRVPLEKLEITQLGNAEVPSIEAHLKLSGHDFIILGTHPLPPIGPEYSWQRNEQLTAIAARVRASQQPTLVIGDLNATPWSHGMKLIQAGGTLGYRSVQPPWAPTWYGSKAMAIPIDHALATAPLVIESRSVGPDLGSDHRPLLIDLRWAE